MSTSVPKSSTPLLCLHVRSGSGHTSADEYAGDSAATLEHFARCVPKYATLENSEGSTGAIDPTTSEPDEDIPWIYDWLSTNIDTD